ncbi:MAG TPA: hypothetical protein VFB23_02220 [Candidatus Acidoferrales bacterium]|jgi:hypothetical protein|nr:hypothetical protein [Candidatus Acidoferrales bacterium]
MRLKTRFRSVIIIAATLVFGGVVRAQDVTPNANSGPAKFLNMVHQELKPGRVGAYEDLESSIARIYNRENISAYWVELESITGPPEVLSLNFYDSSEEMARAMDVLNSALAAHPELVQMQDKLLQENTTSGTTVLAIRREDMGYRANTIDFSKMRFLRVSTVFAHPGYERAFMETQWSLSEASEKVHAQAAWAVYEVIGGLPEPAFVIVTPMESLQEVAGIFEANDSVRKSEGGALQQHLQEMARVAYNSSDTRLFAVEPKVSHVSKQFAASDTQFWAPATIAVAPSSATRSDKPPAKGGAQNAKP